MSQENNKDAQAYYLAAMAVAADEYGVGICQLSLVGDGSPGQGAVLEPLGEWCDLDGQFGFWEAHKVQEYLTMLVAGSVGRLIWMEIRRPQCSRAYAGASLEWRCLSEAIDCLERETDRAFAIALGRLKDVDGGVPNACLFRLWQRAKRMLYCPPRRDQVLHLARQLLKVEQMRGEEVHQFLAGIVPGRIDGSP